MKYRKAILSTVGVLAILAMFASQAPADILPGDSGFALTIDDHKHGGGPPVDLRPPGIFNNSNRKFEFNNTGNPHVVQSRFSLEWTVVADPDPFLHVVYTITNLSEDTEDFTLTSTLPIAPEITGSSLTGGTVSVTLIEAGGDTAELSSADGQPIYQATIDGTPFQSLMNAPQSHTASTYGVTVVPLEEFGSPSPSLVGPPVLSTIGIELNIRLSPGDTASVVATLLVTPEPGTMILLAMGGMTFLARRRRRHI